MRRQDFFLLFIRQMLIRQIQFTFRVLCVDGGVGG